MKSRNTIQRSLVLEAVNRLKCHATADQIYEEIVKNHPTISRATVYRNLALLADRGEIRRLGARTALTTGAITTATSGARNAAGSLTWIWNSSPGWRRVSTIPTASPSPAMTFCSTESARTASAPARPLPNLKRIRAHTRKYS